MDGLEFTEKVVGHLVVLITAFAWPAVVVFLFYTQRAAIAKLIAALNLKSVKGPGGVEVQFAEQLKENAATIAEAKAEVHGPVVRNVGVDITAEAVETTNAEVHQLPSTDPKELVATAGQFQTRLGADAAAYLRTSEALKSRPAVVIDRTWQVVRNSVFRWADFKIPDEDSANYSFRYLLNRLQENDEVDSKLTKAIGELQVIRDEVALARTDWEPTQEQAADYVQNAAQVMALIAQYQQSGLTPDVRKTAG